VSWQQYYEKGAWWQHQKEIQQESRAIAIPRDAAVNVDTYR